MHDVSCPCCSFYQAKSNTINQVVGLDLAEDCCVPPEKAGMAGMLAAAVKSFARRQTKKIIPLVCLHYSTSWSLGDGCSWQARHLLQAPQAVVDAAST
jgi:hypothetical protein